MIKIVIYEANNHHNNDDNDTNTGGNDNNNHDKDDDKMLMYIHKNKANLAGVGPNSRVMDPFSGCCSILLAAAHQQCVGGDVYLNNEYIGDKKEEGHSSHG
jgi:hypothetical protein